MTENRLAYCGQCQDFPCEELQSFYRESPSHELAYGRMLSLRNGAGPGR